MAIAMAIAVTLSELAPQGVNRCGETVDESDVRLPAELPLGKRDIGLTLTGVICGQGLHETHEPLAHGHAGPVGVYEAGHANIESVLPVVIEEERLGGEARL